MVQAITTPSFEKFPLYYGFYKNLQIKRFFHRFCIVVRMFLPTTYHIKTLAFMIFIKSAVDQKSLKLGVVTAWTMSIVEKNLLP